MKIITQIIFASLFTLSTAIAEEIKPHKITSTEHPVALVELYTSQGCSSCPPADKWLSNLENSGYSQDQLIPLALHVDYWDYIGWKDQFAQASFSLRQRKFRQLDRSSSVYTPQIIFNGEDVRKVRFGNSLKQFKKNISPVKYELSMEEGTDKKKLQVMIDFLRIDPEAKKSHLIVVLAENKLQGNIKSGENTGKTLQHEHVVRIWKNLGVLKKNTQLTLPIKKGFNRNNLEVIAFVETSDLKIQQVVKLRLNKLLKAH